MGTQLKSNFKVENKYGAFYTGGTVQISKDGGHIFCQNGDKVEVLELQTGRVVKTIGKESEDDVTCFILSPDDEVLVIAGRSLLLRQFDWKENTVTRTWKAIHFAPISCMSFDVTTTLLATGSADSTIKVWDIVKQYCTHNLRGHSGVISVAEFHPDISKLQLFSAGEDYKIRVWDLKNSVCTNVLESHYSVITSLVFDAINPALYSCGRDNIITVWNLDNYGKEKTIPVYESLEGMLMIPQSGDHSELGVKTNDPHMITAGAKGQLKVWNTSTSQCVHTFDISKSDGNKEEENAESSLTHLTYNQTLNTISVVTYDHNIIMYNIKDLSLYKQFVGYQDEILDIKFMGVNDSHIAVATNSPLVKVYNVDTWDCQILHGHTDTVLALDVSRDKYRFVSASKDNSLLLWQMDKDTYKVQCIGQGKGHTNTVQSVAYSRLNDDFVVSGSQDLTLKVWPLNNDDMDYDTVTNLHAKVTEKVHDKDINSIVIAPNDKFIATGSQDKTAKLWRASDLSLLGIFRGHRRGIWCIQFSPIDQCVATSSADGSIKIWSLSDFSCVKTFEGHDASVLKINFITRGMQLLSAGSDGLLKLWTIKTSECVKTFDEHEDKVWALASNKQEDKLVTGAGDSQIIVWKDVTIEEQEEVRAKQEEFILKDQELQNLVHQKKYLKAIGLAIHLDQPFRVLSIVKEIINEGVGSDDLEKTVLKLKDYQLDAILRYTSTWNTNAKHSHAAHHLLSIILKSYSPEELFKLPNFKSSLEGLLPYTDRHCQRLKRLEQQSTFVNYTWQCMRLVAGESLASSEEISVNESENRTTTSTEVIQHQSSDSPSDENDEISDQNELIRASKKSSNKNLQQSENDDSSYDVDSDLKCQKLKKSPKLKQSNSNNKKDSKSKANRTSLKRSEEELVLKKKLCIEQDKGDSAFSDESDDMDNDEMESENYHRSKPPSNSDNQLESDGHSDDQMDTTSTPKASTQKKKLAKLKKKKTKENRTTRKGSVKSSECDEVDSDDGDVMSKYSGIVHELSGDPASLRSAYTTFKMTGSTGRSGRKKKQDLDTPMRSHKKKKLSTPQSEPVHLTKHTRLKSAKLKKGRKSLL